MHLTPIQEILSSYMWIINYLVITANRVGGLACSTLTNNNRPIFATLQSGAFYIQVGNDSFAVLLGQSNHRSPATFSSSPTEIIEDNDGKQQYILLHKGAATVTLVV
jgi:hypothetical protein